MKAIKEYERLRNNLKQILDNYTFEDLDKLIEESTDKLKETYQDMKQTKQIILDKDMERERFFKEFNDLINNLK